MYNQEIVNQIGNGSIAVIPTDTLYGIVTSINHPESVSKIYNIKNRNNTKPLIILISDIEQLKTLGIYPDTKALNEIDKLWPGPNSLIFPTNRNDLEYLHRGSNTLATRLPQPPELRRLIDKTGPLVAPSANPEGMPPAKNISEARNYFEDKVDLYVDGGEVDKPASRLLIWQNDCFHILRN